MEDTTASDTPAITADAVIRNLPYLRRYARALTGSQQTGDDLAARAITDILDGRADYSGAGSAKEALFSVFQQIWTAAEPDATSADRAREALLLHSVEGFAVAEISAIMGLPDPQALALLDAGRVALAGLLEKKALIIEDDPIVAADLQDLLFRAGLDVVGVATTAGEAVGLAEAAEPDIVLADVNLADNSSGIDAAEEMLLQRPGLPIVYVTAFPEALLTGERPEPAFLISKPYSGEQVSSAVAQALFFAVAGVSPSR